VTAAAGIAAALLIWAAALAVIDWRQRRVPNALLLPVFVATLVWCVIERSGPLGAGWVQSLVGFGLAFALTLPGYSTSRLGAGDVKLAAVLGLLLGYPAVLWMLLAAALLLGAMAFAAMAILGMAGARTFRLPAAVALAGGFAVVVLHGVLRGAGA